MDVADFDFELPDELIAQEPPPSGAARACSCCTARPAALEHYRVRAVGRYLRAGDLLVLNNTSVFPARLLGRRVPSGGAVECLLIQELRSSESDWEALMHPGPEAEAGARVVFDGDGRAAARRGPGAATSTAGGPSVCGPTTERTIQAAIDRIGHIPLPPYIKRERSGRRIASAIRRSMRASAGRLRRRPPACTSRRRCSTRLRRTGVERAEITLHVGYGTFKPVRTESVEDHDVDPEGVTVVSARPPTPDRAPARGPPHHRRRHDDDACAGVAGDRRRWRVLQMSGRDRPVHHAGPPVPDRQRPDHQLPSAASSLLMLVAAFAGRDTCSLRTVSRGRDGIASTATATRC